MSVGSPPEPSGLVQNRWIVNVLRPAALTIMAGCVALPLLQVIKALAPGLHSEFVFAVCILATLEVNYTHRLIRAHLASGVDVMRVRAIEAAFYFVVLKAASLALNGFPAGSPNAWLLDLTWWLDPETLLALVLAIAFAVSVDGALDDFDRVGEAAEPTRNYVSSIDSLTGRFFTGGAVLLVVSGLARINLSQVFNLARPSITGLVGNVLLYFLLGLLLLSQVRLELLWGRWQAQGVRTPADLASRWVRYTLIFVGAAALLAFALPTGFTAGALGWLGDGVLVVALIVWSVLAFLVTLVLLPFGVLMALLAGKSQIVPPPVPPPPPPPNVQTLLNQPLPPWAETVRTLVVVALIGGMAIYIVVNYFHDRPGLGNAVRALGPVQALRRLWAALRHRVSGIVAAAREASAVQWLLDRLRGALPARPGGYFRLGAAAPREQVLFYYLSLLRRAGQQGFGRRPPQTPREYEPVLARNLPEAKADVDALTQAFEETRYSAHPVGPDAAQRARAIWKRVRAALAKQKQP